MDKFIKVKVKGDKIQWDDGDVWVRTDITNNPIEKRDPQENDEDNSASQRKLFIKRFPSPSIETSPVSDLQDSKKRFPGLVDEYHSESTVDPACTLQNPATIEMAARTPLE
eukprot:UN10435